MNAKIMKEAHKMTREIKAEYPEVDYKFQLGLCIKYLLKESKREESKTIGSHYEYLLNNIDFNESELKEVNKRKRVRLLDRDMLMRGIKNQLKVLKNDSDKYTFVFEINYLMPTSFFNDMTSDNNSTKAIVTLTKDFIKVNYERSSAKCYSGSFSEYQSLSAHSCRYLTHIYDENMNEFKLTKEGKKAYIYRY